MGNWKIENFKQKIGHKLSLDETINSPDLHEWICIDILRGKKILMTFRIQWFSETNQRRIRRTFNSFLSASMSCCSSVLVASTALSNSATLDSAEVSQVNALIMSSWNRTMRSNASFRFFLRESDL